MKLIVGLGNPGKEYIGTRHNLGFSVIDELAKDFNIQVTKKFCNSLLGKGLYNESELLLAKPQTYVNLSGLAVLGLYQKYEIDNSIIIYDDMDLPLGKIRFRKDGSAGGHKGMNSIIVSLKRKDISRLRIGIGRPYGEAKDYVLSKFKKAELEIVRDILQKSKEAIYYFITNGIVASMNKYNN
ncbi:MAG: aminoacyl-tRNA hydrolase [Candidatus Firestonebacteria bacterium]